MGQGLCASCNGGQWAITGKAGVVHFLLLVASKLRAFGGAGVLLKKGAKATYNSGWCATG